MRDIKHIKSQAAKSSYVCCKEKDWKS